MCSNPDQCSSVICNSAYMCEYSSCSCKTSQNNVWLSESFTEQTGTFTVECLMRLLWRAE
jgi:hypothetical protein